MADLILAIDSGNTESAYVVIDAATCRPVRFGKIPNEELHDLLHCAAFDDCRHTAIEMIASYGMPVGADVFETCVWIGRFFELATQRHRGVIETVKRLPVKLHHCHTSKAKDSNIGQALVDRFTPGQRNHGKGTKAEPGWFYGFAADVWQAYALAVYVADTTQIPPPTQTAVAPGIAAAAPSPPSVGDGAHGPGARMPGGTDARPATPPVPVDPSPGSAGTHTSGTPPLGGNGVPDTPRTGVLF